MVMQLRSVIALVLACSLIAVEAQWYVRECYDFNGQLLPGGGNCNANDIAGCVDAVGYFHDTPNLCAAVAGGDWVKGCFSRNPGTTQFRANAICRDNPPVCGRRHGVWINAVWCT